MSTKLSKLDREVRRLLLSPAGRESLKRVGGIDVEFVKEKSELPIVAILCPTYRAPEPQMQDALAALAHYTREKGIATVYSGAPVQASVVHWSRNWLITEQLKSGKPWTHLLFIDDDIVVEPDYLERLLSHKKDIVAGICTRRNDPPIPNIRYYDQETGDTHQIWDWPHNRLIEVDAAGTGLMLLSKHAVEQVAQAYFDCLYEQEFFGTGGELLERYKKTRLEAFDRKKIAYWFRFLPTPKGDIEMGEDIFFCFMAKRFCDLKVYADTTVLPGHIGNYPFSVRDFLPYRDMCIRKAKEEGTYKSSSKLSAKTAYEFNLKNWSDIQEHLPRLFEAAKGECIEIGVRTGISTSALLAGLEQHGGHLTSFDITDCSHIFPGHPQWTFRQEDSKAAASLPADVLLIDGDHTYEGALTDLERFGSKARRIFVHDTDGPDWPGVRKAVAEFCEKTERPVTYHGGSYGMAEIEPIPRHFSIVIPSANPDNLIACVSAIIKNEPEFPTERIIVVDDGAREKAEPLLPKLTWIQGRKPFVFARNVNLGIVQADSDVIVLNDDAILQTPEGFTKLAKTGNGIVSAGIKGFVGNENQMARSQGLRSEPRMLCFMAVFITKEVVESIGLLDERFTGYGFEDNDYSCRAIEAGFPLSVFDGCVVEHESVPSTYRSKENWLAMMKDSQEIFEEKYSLLAAK